MRINDKIRDEKLQYNINRETAKISALSQGKFDKYEYLIREEIIFGDERGVIEQARFTYSPLGKALEKRTKPQKQLILKITYFWRKKEIYDKTVAEQNNEINTFSNNMKYDKLNYYFKSENSIPIGFNVFNCPLCLIRKIKSGSIDLKKAKENQEKLGQI